MTGGFYFVVSLSKEARGPGKSIEQSADRTFHPAGGKADRAIRSQPPEGEKEEEQSAALLRPV